MTLSNWRSTGKTKTSVKNTSIYLRQDQGENEVNVIITHNNYNVFTYYLVRFFLFIHGKKWRVKVKESTFFRHSQNCWRWWAWPSRKLSFSWQCMNEIWISIFIILGFHYSVYTDIDTIPLLKTIIIIESVPQQDHYRLFPSLMLDTWSYLAIHPRIG